ncbi:RNA-binding protein [Methyloceanibacter sp.]|uniref:RNA-binding protein n=1 Tax=Methyloceanibacter sp. TaxID=1965321 RepID=UPI003D6D280F
MLDYARKAANVSLMPKGPKGEKRPADVIGAAVMVGKIATGEIVEVEEKPSAAAELGRRGGKARAESMTGERRTEVARKAAKKRWEKRK